MRTLSFLGLETAQRPALNASSIRQLARLGTVVRWPGVIFAAILSLAVVPRSAVGLGAVLVWVAIYNAWGMIAIAKADDSQILRIGRALTLIDTVSYFLVLFVFGGVARLREEPNRPDAELVMAAAGPACSLLFAGVGAALFSCPLRLRRRRRQHEHLCGVHPLDCLVGRL